MKYEVWSMNTASDNFKGFTCISCDAHFDRSVLVLVFIVKVYAGIQ